MGFSTVIGLMARVAIHRSTEKLIFYYLYVKHRISKAMGKAVVMQLALHTLAGFTALSLFGLIMLIVLGQSIDWALPQIIEVLIWTNTIIVTVCLASIFFIYRQFSKIKTNRHEDRVLGYINKMSQKIELIL